MCKQSPAAPCPAHSLFVSPFLTKKWGKEMCRKTGEGRKGQTHVAQKGVFIYPAIVTVLERERNLLLN